MIKMNEDIEKIIKYFKNDAWFTIFNAEELNDEPYKLLNPIEVNQIIDYMTKLQKNWNKLKKWLESLQEYYISMKDKYDYSDEYKYSQDILTKMQELEKVK